MVSIAPYNVVRDFAGYGPTPPNPQWPGGARLAVNFVMNIEEGSEYAIEHGENRSDVGLTESSQPRVPSGSRDLAAESMFEYGTRVGSPGDCIACSGTEHSGHAICLRVGA